VTDIDELGRALDAIERHEARFLAWGILDRALTRDRLEHLLSTESDGDPAELVSELRRRGLLFEVPRTSPPAFRTRMAEGVRLFAKLRQLFPNRPLSGAAHLVADYRFVVRPRRFPHRHLRFEEIASELNSFPLSPDATAALEALVSEGPGGRERRLSRFQVEATSEVLRGLSADRDQACIVTAGTGSGKTLAFYLPTLVHLAASGDLGKGMEVLAVYPRNELLKDQLLATLREVRRLRSSHPDSPVVRIGAYFGPTPLRGGGQALPEYLGWRRSSGGRVCPFLLCPGDFSGIECGGRLVWKDEDRKAKRERLECETCHEFVLDDEFALTRQAMQERPPDIVFTTTEMLNRSLSDEWSRHVFGAGPRASKPPRLILLDEAHTYAGASGAQAAYLLRRWRHLVTGPVVWVGLSATLRDAETFYSALTGVPADRVREVTPRSEDMERRGHEYQLLLRGDPASQAALLSTSIQSLMLLLRLQDPLDEETSLGLFGHKVFAFCDNLDLTNRLYRQLLNAEGRDPIGKPDPAKAGSLALLRSQTHRAPEGGTPLDWETLDRDGQDWWIVDRLRPSPTPPQIGRTSSQDTGVAANAETVIATASLEVGYDDPTVGAVLQHKAPRDLAQFVQRRGRAGRPQRMRPWTVVVLSDYGRDRLAYQNYEQLFDPALPPKSLPLGNRSIQRMQATFAVMDWLANRMATRGGDRSSVRQDLSGPTENAAQKRRQDRELELLQAVLHNEGERRDLVRYLCGALSLKKEDVQTLLWEGPRAVLSEAIPTAVRRLSSDWQAVRGGAPTPQGDRIRRNHPLPEFVPANLFSDLSLPEIQIVAPEGYDDAAETEEPIFLVLNELAPGNVSLRWAVWKTRGLWVDPNVTNGMLDISESLLADGDVIAHVTDDAGRAVDVVRPFSVHPSKVEGDVLESSSGRLDWQVRVTAEHEAVDTQLPTASTWRDVIMGADFFLQAGRGGVRVLRFAAGGRAEIGRRKTSKNRVRYVLSDGHAPVAVGVELDVDALCIKVRPPADIDGFGLSGDVRRLRQLRRDRFVDETTAGLLALDEADEAVDINIFMATWIAELALSAIAFEAERRNGQLPDVASWSGEEWRSRLLGAFDRNFQGLHDDPADESPLRARMEEEAAHMAVGELLTTEFTAAMQPPDHSWYPGLRSRFTSTTAAAIHTAVQNLLPDFDAEHDLVIDIVDDGADAVEIWLTETTVGGGGIVETLYARYAEDPRRFWNLAAATLQPGDAEQTAESLPLVVEGLLRGAFMGPAEVYRAATDDEDAISAWRVILAEVAQSGIPPSHSLSVAMASRLLRIGSSDRSDRAVHLAIGRWDELERQTGFAIDHRTACSILAQNDRVLSALQGAAPSPMTSDDTAWAFSVLLGLLWASPESVRPNALQAPMPFTDSPARTERTLVTAMLVDDAARISVHDEDWRRETEALLATTGTCVLVVESNREQKLHDALLDLMAEPTEVGTLHLHPRLVSLRRRVGGIEAELQLVEAPQ
jgi:hypothetical protein